MLGFLPGPGSLQQLGAVKCIVKHFKGRWPEARTLRLRQASNRPFQDMMIS